MPNNPYIGDESRITTTLSQIFKAQGREEFVKILDSASAEIDETEFDNWNGGTFYYALFLDVPIEVFANIESSLSKYEGELTAKLQVVSRENGNHILNRVVIRPQLVDPNPGAVATQSATERELAIWNGKPIRVFISHQHADRAAASNLRAVLAKLNISAFVAHQDIEPTLPWQSEIKIALNSMDVFVAFLTPNFRGSKWTDQEVGFAVAKQVLIIHVRDGQNPYGFIGETQSLSLPIDQPENLGMAIAGIILKNPILKSKFREALFVALENVGSFAFACKIMKLLQKAGEINPQEIQRIRNAADSNDWVKGAFTVKDFLATHPPVNEVPF